MLSETKNEVLKITDNLRNAEHHADKYFCKNYDRNSEEKVTHKTTLKYKLNLFEKNFMLYRYLILIIILSWEFISWHISESAKKMV